MFKQGHTKMLLWEKTLTEQSLKLLFYWCIYVNFIESQLALLGIEENLFLFFRIFFHFIKRTLSYKLWLLTSMLAHFMPVVSFDTPCFQGVLKETSSVKWVINSTAIYFSKCFILDAWQGYEYATRYCWYVSDQRTRSSQLYLCESFTTWSISWYSLAWKYFGNLGYESSKWL